MEELYRQYAGAVYSFLLSYCGNETVAEDLMQETFLQAYLSLGRYNGTCKISVWLCQIAKHLWYQYLEKQKRECPLGLSPEQYAPLSAQCSATPDPESQVIANQQIKELTALLEDLPEPTRRVMHLRLFGELSFREIGEIMGKSENWARVTWFRGKEKIGKGMKCYEKHANEPDKP